MKKVIILGLILMIGLVVVVSAKMTSYSSDGYNHNVENYLQPGWNLVLNFDLDDISEDSEITKKDIRVAYYFDGDKKEYLQIYPDKTEYSNYISNVPTDMQSYFQFSPIWIYSDKAGFLRYPRVDVPKYNEVALEDGWNFIILTQEMLGKSLDEISGSCNIEKAYFWNNKKLNEDGFWDIINLIETLDSQEIAPVEEAGLGLVIRVTNDCGLGSLSDGTTPPAIPN